MDGAGKLTPAWPEEPPHCGGPKSPKWPGTACHPHRASHGPRSPHNRNFQPEWGLLLTLRLVAFPSNHFFSFTAWKDNPCCIACSALRAKWIRIQKPTPGSPAKIVLQLVRLYMPKELRAPMLRIPGMPSVRRKKSPFWKLPPIDRQWLQLKAAENAAGYSFKTAVQNSPVFSSRPMAVFKGFNSIGKLSLVHGWSKRRAVDRQDAGWLGYLRSPSPLANSMQSNLR